MGALKKAHSGWEVHTIGKRCRSITLCPAGIGFLWGRPEVLESMPPWMGGGEMIQVGCQGSLSHSLGSLGLERE